MTVTKKQAREQLRKGGQRVFQHATAEIFDRTGQRLERQTGAGMKTNVHQLLDPRLDVTQAQRAVGNYFGTLYEKAMGGDGKEFLREYVDSSSKGGGGYSEHKAHQMKMLACGASALAKAPPFIYPVGTARGCKLGRHFPIKPMDLAQRVCVHQRSLSEVAIRQEWTRTPLDGPKKGLPQVPDRQRKAIAAALRDTLDIIAEAWDSARFAVPYDMMTIEVR
ncbi:hypothetical protein [Leisingera sp. M523]|uniref:hypothetical protein n=1 Tax=Leisingera sp. M523 TaxID=2867013 RepID=UPI0021A8570E|nr:hypothetical protein [Leisingera sp. M523]UWQ30239.1 hypothetical protein K3557_06800 [Leisingera sp. M523]